MNLKLFLILALSLALASCATPPPRVTCVEYPGPISECQGDPQAPMVLLNTQTMIVQPECVRAKAGTPIEFHVQPNGASEVGSVTIFPKKPADKWLNGTNSPDQDRITIDVPPKLKKGKHFYGFRTSDKCVDPRVAVE